MAISLVYFVHGTTLDNEKEISSGWSDVELSDKGVAQSLKLRQQTAGRYFDVIFSSDLKRAVHSAELTWQGVYPLKQDVRLRECNYGDLNGAPSEIVEPMQEKCIHECFPNGESYEDVKARVADFLKFLKADYDGKSVAIVAHKAPQLALEVLLKGRSWEQAFAEDWRKRKAWQAGWAYLLK